MGMGNPAGSWVRVFVGWVRVTASQFTKPLGFLWVFPQVFMGWQGLTTIIYNLWDQPLA